MRYINRKTFNSAMSGDKSTFICEDGFEVTVVEPEYGEGVTVSGWTEDSAALHPYGPAVHGEYHNVHNSVVIELLNSHGGVLMMR